MSASTAIGMVSASLRNLLVGEMHLNPALDVTILAPYEIGSDRRVNLFLYRLAENPFLKNQDFTVAPGNPNQLVPTPLSLSLFYLMTPYAPNDPQTGNVTAHQILGEAMRVFYENPVVPNGYLDNGLIGAREHLQIASNELDPEELSRIWTTFSQPFRLSVLYQVSTVQLDTLPQTQRPMPKRVRRVGVPGVRQPPEPPAVSAMSPDAGAAGSTVTFTGEHLAGWRATVSIGGQGALEAQVLTGDQFTATVPVGLLPGFYDVQVDVSRLFRRTFLYEVTP
ncbi:MAG: Pvc16 family protein [Pseudonocardiaceae bacterium]